MQSKLKGFTVAPGTTIESCTFVPGLQYRERLVQGMGFLHHIVLSVEGTMTLQEKTEWAWEWDEDYYREFYERLKLKEEKEPVQDLAYQVKVGPWTILRRLRYIINGAYWLLDVTGYHLHLMNQISGLQLHWSAPTEKGKNLWRLPFVVEFSHDKIKHDGLTIGELVDTGRLSQHELVIEWPTDLSNVLVDHDGAKFEGNIKYTPYHLQPVVVRGSVRAEEPE